MAFRVYLDEDSLDAILVRELRRSGIDVLTAFDEGTIGWSNESQLAYAESLGRVILTANMQDFAALHVRWMFDERHHAGIIMAAHQRTSPVLIARKVALLQTLRDASAVMDATLYLTRRAGQPLE